MDREGSRGKCGDYSVESQGAGGKLRGGRVGVPDLCRSPQSEDTPMHYAAGQGHAAVVEKLLAAGAKLEAKGQVRGERVCGMGIATRWATTVSLGLELRVLRDQISPANLES